MLHQNYVPYKEEMEKAEDVIDYLLEKKLELKGLDDGGML